MSETLKILVVDDTIIYRKILTDAVHTMDGMEVVATANNGKIALAKIPTYRPDVVLLDVAMPEMDGLEALKHIKRDYPGIDVIMVSGTDLSQADITVNALDQGAIDFVAKPRGQDSNSSFEELRRHLQPLLSLLITRRYARGIRKPATAEPKAHPLETALDDVASTRRLAAPVVPGALPSRVDIVVIGVSTGGPNALAELIPRLPGGLAVPVLLVQHMPPLFTVSLAQHLDKKSALTVREAVEDEPVEPGKVLIAPGGRHMTVRKASSGGLVIGLNNSPPVNSCRPSVDVLFRSVAAGLSGNVLAVIMTGMGSDGVEGVRALKRRGCYCLVQDEESCVVYGMPRAVVEYGLADEVVPLGEIANRITRGVERMS